MLFHSKSTMEKRKSSNVSHPLLSDLFLLIMLYSNLLMYILQDVLKATSIAMEYRQKFRKDVIIDFICYRKYGHNELDDPSFTQPVMYNIINNRQSIPDSYKEQLMVSL